MAVSAGKAKVIVTTYAGKEAQTILAQATGYKRIAWMVLRGDHDRDPDKFIRDVRQVMFEQAQEGA
jgi:hypothetical protein